MTRRDSRQSCTTRSRSSSPTSGRCRASSGLRRGLPAERRQLPHRRPARADRRRRAARASTRRASRIVVGERDARDRRRAGPRPQVRRRASTSRWRSSTARSSGRSGCPRTSTPSRRTREYERGIVTISLPVAERRRRRRGRVTIAVERAMTDVAFEHPGRPGRPRDRAAGDAAGAAAQGDGRLPAVDDAARDRAGALGAPDRRRRRRRPLARARDRAATPSIETPGWDDIYEVGTVAIVHKMIKVPDGTLRILVGGPPARAAREAHLRRPVPRRPSSRRSRTSATTRPRSRR